MPRRPRMKFEEGGGWYHLYNSLAATAGEYPLVQPRERRKFIFILKFYVHAYCCQLASFQLMGNHFHAVIRFDQPRQMCQAELLERAARFYPDSPKMVEAWSLEDWDRFAKRIFDVSELMRNIGAAYAKWYNTEHNRKGYFWADRFKSVMLTCPQIVLACIAYVELNALRAKLVKRPEDYEGGSLHLREIRKDDWLLAIEEFSPDPEEQSYESFKALIYYRGAVKTKEGQAVIPPEVIERERRRGFARRGMYLAKLRFFVDGMLLGCEQTVGAYVKRLKRCGHYLRRVNPISVGSGGMFALREQRSHFRELRKA